MKTPRTSTTPSYCEPHAKGFRLIVAIADVSYYVRRGTALDASARERGHQRVFPDARDSDAAVRAVERVVLAAAARRSPVFRGGHDRLAHRRADGSTLLSGRDALGRAAHLTTGFRRADREASRKRAPNWRRSLDKLLPLVDVYRALLKARHKRGALEFDAAEAEFDIDAAGRIQRVYMYERNEAHKLIEECMILANVAVARELGVAPRRHAVSRAWQARRKKAQPCCSRRSTRSALPPNCRKR